MKVEKAKKNATVDSFCFYTLRGSFPGTKQSELKTALEHETVQEEFLGTACGNAESRGF